MKLKQVLNCKKYNKNLVPVEPITLLTPTMNDLNRITTPTCVDEIKDLPMPIPKINEKQVSFSSQLPERQLTNRSNNKALKLMGLQVPKKPLKMDKRARSYLENEHLPRKENSRAHSTPIPGTVKSFPNLHPLNHESFSRLKQLAKTIKDSITQSHSKDSEPKLLSNCKDSMDFSEIPRMMSKTPPPQTGDNLNVPLFDHAKSDISDRVKRKDIKLKMDHEDKDMTFLDHPETEDEDSYFDQQGGADLNENIQDLIEEEDLSQILDEDDEEIGVPLDNPDLDKLPVKSQSVLSKIKPGELKVQMHRLKVKSWKNREEKSIENMWDFLVGNGFNTKFEVRSFRNLHDYVTKKENEENSNSQESQSEDE